VFFAQTCNALQDLHVHVYSTTSKDQLNTFWDSILCDVQHICHNNKVYFMTPSILSNNQEHEIHTHYITCNTLQVRSLQNLAQIHQNSNQLLTSFLAFKYPFYRLIIWHFNQSLNPNPITIKKPESLSLIQNTLLYFKAILDPPIQKKIHKTTISNFTISR
jgi:hypothetical protein